LTEITIMNKMTRRSFFKRAARKLLFSDWTVQVLAFLIAGAFFVGINQIGVCFETLVVSLTGRTEPVYFFSSLYTVLSLALTIPVLYGLVKFEINAIDGKGDIADMFSVFSSLGKLGRVYKLFFHAASRTVVCYLPFIAAWTFLNLIYYEGIFGIVLTVYSVDLFRLLLSALVGLMLYLGLLLSAKYFVGIYLCVLREDTPIKECFLVAANCNFMSKGELTGTLISFLPLCLLSLLTAGLLFILYTIPYMLITMVMVSKYIVDVEMYKKSTSALMYENNINPGNE